MAAELIAGEGGAVLVAAATSTHATALACEGLAAATKTPSGIPVYPVEQLPPDLAVERVRLLACEPRTQAAIRSWGAKRGVAVLDDTPPLLPTPDGVRIA